MASSIPISMVIIQKMNIELDWQRIIEWSHTETTYLLRVVVSPEQLELELQDKFSGDLWQGVYLSHAIEQLTEKAKNRKRYGVFVSMLRSALQKNKENLFIEVLSYREIMIRTRANSTTVPQEHAFKRFLILNYNLEFEKIQFPIPIKHFADAPPERLKMTIKRLAQDVNNFRNQRSQSELERENAYLKYELDSLRARQKNGESQVLRGKMDALQREVNEKNSMIDKLNNNTAQLQNERKNLLEKLVQSQQKVISIENQLRQRGTTGSKQSQNSKASEQKLEQLIVKMKKLADDLIFAQQKQKKSQIKISTLQKQLQNMQKNQQQRTTVRYKEDRDRQRNDSPLSRSEKQLSVKSGRSNKSNKSSNSKKNISSIIKGMKGTANPSNPNINYRKYSNKKSSVYDSDTQSSRMRRLNNGRSSPYRQTTTNKNSKKTQKQRSRSKSRQKVVSPKPSNIVQSQMYSQAFQSDDSQQRFERLQRQIKTVKGKPQASRKTTSRVTGVSKEQNIQNKLQSLEQMIRRAAISTKQKN